MNYYVLQDFIIYLFIIKIKMSFDGSNEDLVNNCTMDMHADELLINCWS